MLTEAQRLPTLGATDFRSFVIAGTTYLAVSNEQDDAHGGDVQSTLWALTGEGQGQGKGEHPKRLGDAADDAEDAEGRSPRTRDEL